MKKRIDRQSEEHKRLIALGYRADPNVVAECVNRLRMDEKPWQLYGATAKDPIVSQDLGIKIGRDYADGKLNFLAPFHVDENEKAIRDPFRITRYGIVVEAEEMAPHKLWNLKHIKGLSKDYSPQHSDLEDAYQVFGGGVGIDHDRAVEQLEEYDSLRDIRVEAEVTLTDFQFEDGDGKSITLKTPPVMAMRNFRGLSRYLAILYQMHYRTEYSDAPQKWINRACEVRVSGRLIEQDDRLVVTADNIFRYQVWESQENLDSYFQGLVRLSKTKGSHLKFVEGLRKKFGIGRDDD